MMAHSRDNQRFGDLSKIVDELFGEIVMRLDITSAVRLAACSKEFYRQVACSRCPNDLCWKLVAYHEVHDHKISCPHRPCTCTEPGCEFTAPPAALLAPPAALLVHLREAHLLEVHGFQYDKIVRYNSQPLRAPGSSRVQIIGSEDDGMVFAMQFHTRNTETLISVNCVRMAACLSAQYKVMLWAWFRIDGGGRMPEWWPAEGWQAVEDQSILGADEAMASMRFQKEFELTNNALPEELRNHLKVFWTLLPIREPLQTMDYWLRIVNIDDTYNTS